MLGQEQLVCQVLVRCLPQASLPSGPVRNIAPTPVWTGAYGSCRVACSPRSSGPHPGLVRPLCHSQPRDPDPRSLRHLRHEVGSPRHKVGLSNDPSRPRIRPAGAPSSLLSGACHVHAYLRGSLHLRADVVRGGRRRMPGTAESCGSGPLGRWSGRLSL